MDNEWLNLSETAELLGVHPTTVRTWADRGELPMQRTAGGHRRFRRNDVQSRVLTRDRNQETVAQIIIQGMLGRARLELTEGVLNNELWYQQFDEQARSASREIGHRLLQVVMRYLIEHDEQQTLAEARQIGQDYQRLGQESGLRLVDTTRAYLYFREFLTQTVYDMAQAMGAQGPTDWREARSRVIRISNEVFVALIEASTNDVSANETSANEASSTNE